MSFRNICYIIITLMLLLVTACVPSPDDPPATPAPATATVTVTPATVTPAKYIIDLNSVTPQVSDGDAGKYNQLIVDPSDNATYIAYVSDGKALNLIDPENNTVVMPIATTTTSFGPVAMSVSVQNSDSVLDLVYYEASVGFRHVRALIKNLTSAYVWTPTTIAGTVAASDDNMTIGLVSDNATNLHLTFFNNTTSSLDYAYFDGSAAAQTWSAVEQVDPPAVAGDIVGRFSSIALDDANEPHVAYYYYTASNANGNLKYADKHQGLWHKKEILSTGEIGRMPVVSQSSGDNATSDKDDIFDIVYYNATAKGGSIQWLNSKRGFTANQAVTLDSWDDGNSTIIAMAAAPDGALYAAYQKKKDVILAVFSVISPLLQTVDTFQDNGGYFVSLDVDRNNSAHVAYYDPTDHDLKYARTKAP